jgi:hypothetical protein
MLMVLSSCARVTEPVGWRVLAPIRTIRHRFVDCFSRRTQRDAASQCLDALFNDSGRMSIPAVHAG